MGSAGFLFLSFFSYSPFSRLLGIYLILGPVRVVSASGSVVVEVARRAGFGGNWPLIYHFLGLSFLDSSFSLCPESPLVAFLAIPETGRGLHRVVFSSVVVTGFDFVAFDAPLGQALLAFSSFLFFFSVHMVTNGYWH